MKTPFVNIMVRSEVIGEKNGDATLAAKRLCLAPPHNIHLSQ